MCCAREPSSGKELLAMHTSSTRRPAAVVLLVAVAALLAATPVQAASNAVLDWNSIASDTIVARAGQPPAVSALSFAIAQGAVYDAVNAIDQLQHQPYLGAPPANPWDSKEAAVATAAYDVLTALFPAQVPTL